MTALKMKWLTGISAMALACAPIAPALAGEHDGGYARHWDHERGHDGVIAALVALPIVIAAAAALGAESHADVVYGPAPDDRAPPVVYEAPPPVYYAPPPPVYYELPPRPAYYVPARADYGAPVYYAPRPHCRGEHEYGEHGYGERYHNDYDRGDHDRGWRGEYGYGEHTGYRHDDHGYRH
jgi:hypothetical protein